MLGLIIDMLHEPVWPPLQVNVKRGYTVTWSKWTSVAEAFGAPGECVIKSIVKKMFLVRKKAFLFYRLIFTFQTHLHIGGMMLLALISCCSSRTVPS